MEEDYRSKASGSLDLKNLVQNNINATRFWEKKNKSNEKPDNGTMILEKLKNCSDIPPLQATDQPPIMVGGDVKTLYPALDVVSTCALVGEAMRKSELEMEGIDFNRLAVYLTLVLGIETLSKLGLNGIIPLRIQQEDQSYSLLSKQNRNLTAWQLRDEDFQPEVKREMLTLMVQIMTILLMGCHVYSFGGHLFLQKKGAGIGLRSSACLARVCMCLWDTKWASIQNILGLTAILFLRYVDDLRLYLFPINRGWSWDVITKSWKYQHDTCDKRTFDERTKEELRKSFDSVIDCLSFTTETQDDFVSKTLPTLDFQTTTYSNGYIDFTHFSKPMSNNLVIEAGTALPKGTIFSSLRQDLVRRLLNTNRNTPWKNRIQIIEDYTQLLLNSGHKYPFIRAVVTQAITKYEYMYYRSKLHNKNPRFRPLYRNRSYQENDRQIMKYLNPQVWYKDVEIGDCFRKQWKRGIKRKFNRKNKTSPRRDECVKFCSTMFVPSTMGGKLADMISETEEKLRVETGWATKILEKSGTPLVNVLQKKFPIDLGCPTFETCLMCNPKCLWDQAVPPTTPVGGEVDAPSMVETPTPPTGVPTPSTNLCQNKNLVYEAICQDCPDQVMGDWRPTYVGETSRTLRSRAKEHVAGLQNLNPKSFIVKHWMMFHGTHAIPPRFVFKILKKYRDPLSRQIGEALYIMERGILNSKLEFGVNELCSIETSQPQGDLLEAFERDKQLRAKTDGDIKQFVYVMNNVKSAIKVCSNHNNASRLNFKKRKPGETTSVEGAESCRGRLKKLRMDSSTPNSLGHRQQSGIELSPESPIMQQEETNNSVVTEESNLSENPENTNRTNLSNELRGSRIGERTDRRFDSSEEYSIDALCLENVLNEKGIVGVIPDIESLRRKQISRLLDGLNIDNWSPGSFSNSDSSRHSSNVSPTFGAQSSLDTCRLRCVGNQDPKHQTMEDPNTNQDTTPPPCLSPVGGEVDAPNLVDAPPPPTGTRPKLSIAKKLSYNLDDEDSGPVVTPKRKLSPTDDAQEYLPRKRFMSVHNSSSLRSSYTRNEGTSPSTDSVAPPDLIVGIGRLELRPVNPAQRILSGISRQRSSSLGDSQRGRRSPSRIGRRRRLSTIGAGSNGQRLITEMLTRDSSVVLDDSSVTQQAEHVKSQAMGEEEEN